MIVNNGSKIMPESIVQFSRSRFELCYIPSYNQLKLSLKYVHTLPNVCCTLPERTLKETN